MSFVLMALLLIHTFAALAARKDMVVCERLFVSDSCYLMLPKMVTHCAVAKSGTADL
jgi:hypothetical protein